MKKILLAFLLLLSFSYASAWDGVISGKITKIESVGGASEGQNFDLRVTLSPGVAACTAGTFDWTYINAGDYNYKGLMSVLLMAQAMDKTVTIYSNKVGGGFCHIGWVIVS